MDYEAIDREMSAWVVTSKMRTTRFFLTDEGLPTDIISRARLFSTYDRADIAAESANQEKTWADGGFDWSPQMRASCWQ